MMWGLRRTGGRYARAALVVCCLAGLLSPAGAFAAPGGRAAGRSSVSAAELPRPTDATSASAQSASPLLSQPSKTEPYAACPPPRSGQASCQSIVVPPAAKLSALTASAIAQTGGIDGSGLAPAELQSAYQLPSASAGEGQTVALVDAFDDPTAESDLATYRSDYGLPACTAESGCFRKVNQTGGSDYPPLATAEDGDWELEESLDLDMVSAGLPQMPHPARGGQLEHLRKPHHGRAGGGDAGRDGDQQQLGVSRVQLRERLRLRLRRSGHTDHRGERR